MTPKDDLLFYYDDIRRLAESKCDSREDAEDLTSETFLAAFSFLRRYGSIEHPKTWLANTLMHKFHSMLRKKYHQPAIVAYDTLSLPEPEEDAYERTEEAAEVRQELLYLSQATREVLIRFYYNGYSVADIARQLGIPEGTVKSRLSSGRAKIKKGLTDMAEKKNNIPGILNVSCSGFSGPNNEPLCLVENDLIAQNLLVLAYERPLSILELAEAISIPTVYIEPIVKRLADGELMAQTDSGKYYTDFIIYHPEDFLSKFEAQSAFAHEHFDRIWSIMEGLLAKIHSFSFCRSLNIRQLRKLERYALLCALQSFQINLSNDNAVPPPNRRDGGRWIAMGWAFPGGFDDKEYQKLSEYTIQGGHRSEGGDCSYAGAKYLRLCEFDTTLLDNPSRWNDTCGFTVYFREIRELLWCIYKGIPMEQGNISNSMLEGIDRLIAKTGLITRENGKLSVDIPVMTQEAYRQAEEAINDAYGRLAAELGREYRAYLKGNMLAIPKHLNHVPTCQRYFPVTNCLVMLIIREAYEKGLHLADVDYCCPPAVLIYGE